MALTAVTYNLRDGGGGRLDTILEVLRAQRPDVLALQELRGFGRPGDGRLARLAAALGLRAVLARSWFGQPVAVLGRGEPISGGPVRGPLHHAAARLVLPTDRGPLTVVGTHLYPHSGARRRWEARWLAWRARPRGLALLMGDLNSLDPWTGHADRLRHLPPEYRGRHLRHGGAPDTRAVATLAAAGYVDLFRHAGTGPPDTVPTAYAGQEFTGMRLDYVLGSPAVAALTRDCRVVTGGPAEVASDHYPVVTSLDLTVDG